jgi:hypothetical protein
MMNLRLAILFLIAVLYVSCTNKGNDQQKRLTTNYLDGFWIPQSIEWGGDNPNGVDTGDVFRTAHFRTLSFDTINNRFLYFSSTQRRPKGYDDSIIFAGEPIVNVFGGSWRYINDTLLMINYKPIEWEINPPDSNQRKAEITVSIGKDTLLFFENVVYIKTLKYDQVSQQTIKEYKKNYLK